MSNCADLLRPKRTTTGTKKISALKRMKRRKNQSLQKLISKMKNSMNDSSISLDANETCITINDSKSSTHDLTDGENAIFFEDTNGDDGLHATVMKDVANRTEKSKENVIRKRQNLDKSREKRRLDKCERFSPLPKRCKTAMSSVHSSTPISKNRNFNISDLSAVTKLSSPNSSSGSLSKQIDNLSREITKDYVTIDLTNGTEASKSVIDLTKNRRCRNDSVIDLDIEDGECTITSISQDEVTVIDVIEKQKDKLNSEQIAEGIAQMNASEKGRLLAMITDKIFNGCKMPTPRKTKPTQDHSAEDTYIREMISGKIRDSIGGNVYNPSSTKAKKTGLRMIVIDGSNVAMQHGMKRIFSVKGLKICIDYFLKRGHTVKAFVPQYRCHAGKSSDPPLLDYLERRGLVVYTPSRKLESGRCFSSYDDRYIVQCAAEFDGIIVSQDRYRDLVSENPSWRKTVETRLLQYTWVQDMVMFPSDPLGKDGPSLDEFLRHS